MQRDTKNFPSRRPTDLAMLNVKKLEALLKIDQKTIYRRHSRITERVSALGLSEKPTELVEREL